MTEYKVPSFRIVEKRISLVSKPWFEIEVDRLTQIPIVKNFKFPFSWWATIKIRETEDAANKAIIEYLGIGASEKIRPVMFTNFDKYSERKDA
jgi:hypothetical protein